MSDYYNHSAVSYKITIQMIRQSTFLFTNSLKQSEYSIAITIITQPYNQK